MLPLPSYGAAEADGRCRQPQARFPRVPAIRCAWSPSADVGVPPRGAPLIDPLREMPEVLSDFPVKIRPQQKNPCWQECPADRRQLYRRRVMKTRVPVPFVFVTATAPLRACARPSLIRGLGKTLPRSRAAGGRTEPGSTQKALGQTNVHYRRT
jgi:hypothetical protein